MQPLSSNDPFANPQNQDPSSVAPGFNPQSSSNPGATGAGVNSRPMNAVAQNSNPATPVMQDFAQSAEPVTAAQSPAAAPQYVDPNSYSRPVGGWPPNQNANPMTTTQDVYQTPAPSQANNLEQEFMEIGEEVVDAAETPNPSLSSFFRPSSPTIDREVDSGAMVSSDPMQNQANLAIARPPSEMTDSQADQLFEEDSSTPKKKRGRGRKLALSLISILLLAGFGLGGYVFYFGSKAATDYNNSSKLKSYTAVLGSIEASLKDSESDSDPSAELQKLKDLNSQPTSLKTVFLGDLNPKYKKASQKASQEKDIATKAKQFEQKLEPGVAFIAEFSSAFNSIYGGSSSEGLNLNTTTAEELSKKFKTNADNCKKVIDNLATLNPPEEFKSLTDFLKTKLQTQCYEAYTNLANSLNGKTGVLNPEDLAKVTEGLTSIGQNLSSLLTGTGDLAYETSKLEQYSKTMASTAAALKDQAQKAINL